MSFENRFYCGQENTIPENISSSVHSFFEDLTHYENAFGKPSKHLLL
jgi:hypothetical protein